MGFLGFSDCSFYFSINFSLDLHENAKTSTRVFIVWQSETSSIAIYRWQSTNVILSSVWWSLCEFKNRCKENIKEPDTPSHYEVKESYPSDSSNHNFWRTEAWMRRLLELRDPHRKFDLWCSDLLSLKHLLSAQACVQVLLFSIVFHFWLFNTDSFTNKIIKN